MKPTLLDELREVMIRYANKKHRGKWIAVVLTVEGKKAPLESLEELSKEELASLSLPLTPEVLAASA